MVSYNHEIANRGKGNYGSVDSDGPRVCNLFTNGAPDLPKELQLQMGFLLKVTFSKENRWEELYWYVSSVDAEEVMHLLQLLTIKWWNWKKIGNVVILESRFIASFGVSRLNQYMDRTSSRGLLLEFLLTWAWLMGIGFGVFFVASVPEFLSFYWLSMAHGFLSSWVWHEEWAWLMCQHPGDIAWLFE